ncbi:DUF559 domain-containing protein [Mobiluncus mulieris]|uniref:DUF559 domain-containing protein n=1 Tax=Mobiluncus mulieris TaxID=2052 RepID=UPI00242F9CA1|nr:DUF559 domain-containing protein [Mobiluncus mulieris]
MEQCLLEVMRHHDPETALILLESAVYNRHIRFYEGEALIAQLSAKKRHSLRHFTNGAQSGSETRVRLFFNQRGIAVKTQEYLNAVGWVDLLVGKSLIVECDSLSHHTQTAEYHNDRVRDLNARLLGYQVLRLSYPQIWRDWGNTKKMLARILATKRYSRWPRQI